MTAIRHEFQLVFFKHHFNQRNKAFLKSTKGPKLFCFAFYTTFTHLIMPINYSSSSAPEALEKLFNIEISENYVPNYNCHPTQLLPVITSENPEGLSFFYWGINPGFVKSKSASQKLLFAPCEELLKKTSLIKKLKRQRCVVPANGFYDWKTLTKKGRVPYRFHLNDNAPFAIAGLWDEFENEHGESIHSFMIITTPSSKDVSDITDRMPAILKTDLIVKWLSDTLLEDDLLSFITPYSESPIDRYTVNPKIAEANFNHANLFDKIQPADQHGNFTLFD